MDLAAAMAFAKPIRASGTAMPVYDLGADGLLQAEPGALPGCPYDIRVDYSLPDEEPHPPDHNAYFRDLDRRRQHPDFDRFMAAVEAVFAGGCPLVAHQTHLQSYVDAPDTRYNPRAWLCLLQLFMVEQDLNYGPGGRRTFWTPPSGFHMEYVRWVAAGTDPLSVVMARNRSKGFPPAFPAPFGGGAGRPVKGPAFGR